MRVVIDSNRLQSDELRAFLTASGDNKAVLTDYAWMEAYKGNSVKSIVRSMAVLCDFPDQVVLLRGTKAVGALDARAPGIAERMILPRSAGQFAETVKGLRQAIEGKPKVIAQILSHGRAAEEQMAKVLADASQLPAILADIAGILSPEEVRACRKGTPYQKPMFEKVLAATNRMCDNLFGAHPGKPRRPSRKSRVNTFLFRHSLAAVLYLLDWIREGGQLDKRRDRVRNDLIDLNFATYGTYFNGVMSDDAKLRVFHEELRIVLRLLGARMPPDYVALFLDKLR